MATPTYDLIASQVLSTSAASVTFSSIPATYRDLVLVVEALGDGGNAATRVQFNGDTGTNYSVVSMVGNGTSALSSTFTGLDRLNLQTASTTARSLSVLQILDYSATDKHKSCLSRHGRADDVAVASAFRWADTSAITSIFVFTSSNNYAAGSTFYLFGIAS